MCLSHAVYMGTRISSSLFETSDLPVTEAMVMGEGLISMYILHVMRIRMHGAA